MAQQSKIVDWAEVRTWLEEGRTYQWMQEQYLEKYNLPVSRTTFMNARVRLGLPSRQSESQKVIIPWQVRQEHHNKGWYLHLHAAARLADGLPVSKNQKLAFESWWADMQDLGYVVTYEPDTGFYPVPKREGIDNGYIREPDRSPVPT